jgi:GNAT superfamily N-acetyltransferase
MTIQIYTTADPAYEQEYALRNRVLRFPLGRDLKDEDLSRDEADFHIGLFEMGKLRSVLLLHPVDEQTLQMRQVCTDPDFQGKGLGRQLVQAAEDFARTRGYTRIVLHGRASAAGFYRKLGYQTDEVLFHELGIPHYSFWKELQA